MAKKTGAGIDALFGKETQSEKKIQAVRKEKLFCEIDSDIKEQVQIFKIKNKTSLNKLVNEALREYLEKHVEKGG